MERSIRRAGKHTSRTVRRAWVRHADRLATDQDYRDALIDIAFLIATTAIRHPLVRLLDSRLVLRWGNSGRRTHDEDRGSWRPG